MAEPLEPVYSFSIPSVQDDTTLDCRVYHPKDLHKISSEPEEASRCVKGAVIAHPYAPLGGCFDDSVVLSVTESLLDKGFVVGTFNFRYGSIFISSLRRVLTIRPEARETHTEAQRGRVKQSKATTYLSRAS